MSNDSSSQHDNAAGQESKSAAARMPRWVKAFIITAAALVVLMVVVMLVTGGHHGPGRHLPSTSGSSDVLQKESLSFAALEGLRGW